MGFDHNPLAAERLRLCYESSLFDLIKAAIKTMVTAMVKDINWVYCYAIMSFMAAIRKRN